MIVYHTAWDDPWVRQDERLDRAAATAGEVRKPVIPPRTAYLTSKLLREIVTTGHSGPIRATQILSAGKTGTSSHTSDVWFVGYTSRWMTTAWIGDDTYQRQLGFKDASFMLSVPMWARYMYEVARDQPLKDIPWAVPPGVKASDTGGPLKKGYPPPPPPGFDLDGKPIALPTTFHGQPIQKGQAPTDLVRPKDVRVQSAAPETPTSAVPKTSR